MCLNTAVVAAVIIIVMAKGSSWDEKFILVGVVCVVPTLKSLHKQARQGLVEGQK